MDKGIHIILSRASILPLFRKLRPFTSGFFPSALKNPTYTELRSHMAIFMACTHDLLPPQIVRCMRHFIDFVQQALAKEHTEETLADMQESLRLYNNTFAIQMANYVMYRDLLFDTYQAASSEEIKSKMKGKISNCGNMNTPDTAQDPDLVPSSPLMSNNPTNFDELSEKHPSLKELYNLTRIYLSTLKDGEKPVKLKNMPKPKNNKIYAYQTLKINDTDDRGTSYTEFIRANPSFHRRARYDFVQTKDGYFVQVLLFFNIERTFTMESDDPFCDVVEERLCLVRVFTYIEEVHASGLQVVKYPNDSDIRQQGLCVMSIKNIERLVHVVPDFSTALNQIEEEDGIYDCYLVNHDIDPNHWSYGATKNFIDIPDQELVKWS
ncbi:hypothetical protein BJV82DRAFT_582562 [Fennellomyces sp. T-0311]|nr:hypothetical protein BJV82DRAFT_584193 [Fennellomyces sp. T-0311]KAI8138720.1 hypothetical protein BJV82DRAFT_582562 [Fennellomyces sp. T-0311]